LTARGWSHFRGRSPSIRGVDKNVGGPEVNITSPCRIQLKRMRKKIEEDDFPMDFWPFGGSNYGYGSLGALQIDRLG